MLSQLPSKRTYAGATNVQFVPQADISARLADGLIFEFELFELPYSAPDPRLGHSRCDGVLRGGADGGLIPTYCADS
jgi:hypothetical protein